MPSVGHAFHFCALFSCSAFCSTTRACPTLTTTIVDYVITTIIFPALSDLSSSVGVGELDDDNAMSICTIVPHVLRGRRTDGEIERQ